MKVSLERFRMLMTIAGASNGKLGDAVGKSRGYVGQVRTGQRTHVPYEFVARAGDYLGARLAEPGVVAVALIEDEPEDKAGGE